MALDWSKGVDQGVTRIGYVVKISAMKDEAAITFHWAGVDVFPNDWTDPESFDFYESRVSGLRIGYDLGTFNFMQGSVLRETVDFRVFIGRNDTVHDPDGPYGDSLWTDLLGTRLEGATYSVWAVDPDTDDKELLSSGMITSELDNIGPNADLPIRGIGGPVELDVPLKIQRWSTGDRVGADLTDNEVEQEGINGKLRRLVFGDPMRVACHSMGKDVPGFSNANHLMLVPSYTKFDSGSNTDVTYELPQNTANSVAFNVHTADDPTYQNGDVPMPYIEENGLFLAGLAWVPALREDNIATVRADWSTWGFVPEIIGWLLFDTGGDPNDGYLQLGTGATIRDSTLWTAFNSKYTVSPFEVTFCVPGPTDEDVASDSEYPTLRELLMEMLWYVRADHWWTYEDENRIHAFEDNEWDAADAVEILPDEILRNSLSLSFGLSEYQNQTVVISAKRMTEPDAVNDYPSEPIGKFIETYNLTTDRTAIGGRVVSKTIQLKWLAASAGDFDDVTTFRAQENAQQILWYEWTEAHVGMERGLHDIIKFSIGNFPTSTAQIRSKIVSVDRRGGWSVRFRSRLPMADA